MGKLLRVLLITVVVAASAALYWHQSNPSNSISSSLGPASLHFAAKATTKAPEHFRVVPGRPDEESGSSENGQLSSPTSSTTTAVGSPTAVSQSSDAPLVPTPIVSKRQTSSTSRLGGSGLAGPAAVLPNFSDSSSVSDALPWVFGQARGYAILPLMQPEARQAAESQINTMLASRVRDLYLSALVDGTFGVDFEYLNDVLRRLSTEGRSVLLSLYFSNGPTMRRAGKTQIQAPFVQFRPERFRSLIQNNPTVRDQFKRIVRAARPSFQLNLTLGPANRNVAIVMLEDNFDDLSYASARRLADEELQNLAFFIRNPCRGCWPGNTTESFGEGHEVHDAASILGAGLGDGITLDGTGYAYTEENAGRRLTPPQLEQLLRQSLERGVQYFGLWRAEHQGIPPDGSLLAPEQRTYLPVDAHQAQQDIHFLRFGLAPLQ